MTGTGVATMHYMGMAALRMRGHVSYDPATVVISVGGAIVAATLALYAGHHRACAARELRGRATVLALVGAWARGCGAGFGQALGTVVGTGRRDGCREVVGTGPDHWVRRPVLIG
ncbi:MHYT domain-containing protein [Yinghuangia sp. YIM S09857]|uniref:MHYT domain-containing protein n=1 Tax=Yinghuangia sp. YIM S09857 TaxID=3436929 RepID=UPI003F529C1A